MIVDNDIIELVGRRAINHEFPCFISQSSFLPPQSPQKQRALILENRNGEPFTALNITCFSLCRSAPELAERERIRVAANINQH